MMMASPTAASAAATVITKKAKSWPSIAPAWRDAATEATLSALSITSMLIRITRAERRSSTPTSPITNRMALTSRTAPVWIMSVRLPADHEDRADHRHQQEQAGDLEGIEVVGEEEP